jgi:hypothetical protein
LPSAPSSAAELLARALLRRVSIKFRLGSDGTVHLRITRGGLSKTFTAPIGARTSLAEDIELLCEQALRFRGYGMSPSSAPDDFSKPEAWSGYPVDLFQPDDSGTSALLQFSSGEQDGEGESSKLSTTSRCRGAAFD